MQSMLLKPPVFLLAAVFLALQGSPVRAQVAPGKVHDAQDHLTFQIPAGWPLSTRDRELSTFHQEARTAPRTARLRFVAAMPENPYPDSTFSGAHFYLSVTAGETAAQCSAQAGSTRTQVAGYPARQGHDQHGMICTQFRDDVYTLRRRGACLRFDLASNNFCGGDASGVRDLTPEQTSNIQQRLKTILDSVRFER